MQHVMLYILNIRALCSRPQAICQHILDSVSFMVYFSITSDKSQEIIILYILSLIIVCILLVTTLNCHGPNSLSVSFGKANLYEYDHFVVLVLLKLLYLTQILFDCTKVCFYRVYIF